MLQALHLVCVITANEVSHCLPADVSTARESCMNLLFAQGHCPARDRPVTMGPDVLQDGALRLLKLLRISAGV